MITCILNVVGANPCEHGGRCLNTKGSFQCKCLQGYEGPRCEMDVNECMSNPCHNDATCLDQIGGFHCICMPGKGIGLYHMERERGKLNAWIFVIICTFVTVIKPWDSDYGIRKHHDFTNISFFLMCPWDFRVRGCLLPHQHRWVCQSTLSQQRQVHRQDQLLPLRVP